MQTYRKRDEEGGGVGSRPAGLHLAGCKSVNPPCVASGPHCSLSLNPCLSLMTSNLNLLFLSPLFCTSEDFFFS